MTIVMVAAAVRMKAVAIGLANYLVDPAVKISHAMKKLQPTHHLNLLLRRRKAMNQGKREGGGGKRGLGQIPAIRKELSAANGIGSPSLANKQQATQQNYGGVNFPTHATLGHNGKPLPSRTSSGPPNPINSPNMSANRKTLPSHAQNFLLDNSGHGKTSLTNSPASSPQNPNPSAPSTPPVNASRATVAVNKAAAPVTLTGMIQKKVVGPTYFHLMVLRKVLLLNDGRDKVLKCVQYGAKLILWANFVGKLQDQASKRGWTLPALFAAAAGKDGKAEIIPRLEKLVSHLSMARKIVRLAHILEPIDSLVTFLNDRHQRSLLIPRFGGATKQAASGTCKPSTTATLTSRALAFGTLVGAVVGIVNDLSDDTVALSKMGVLEKSWSKTCTPISDRMWFTSIFIDVHELLQDYISLRARLAKLEREAAAGVVNRNDVPEDMRKLHAVAAGEEMKKIRDKLFVHKVSLAKLSADFVFCAYDVFDLGSKGWDEGWQTVSGLVAAILGTSKLWMKHSK
ncbi:hypothetical protein HDU96_007557 [Phlyctochytrium bullatum]|nr:hypothetical protein HDU96_007557 [Phlyctochytrium bullatum]